MASQRLLAEPSDKAGTHSVRARANRAILRDIDWARKCGLEKWLTDEGRLKACEEYLQAGTAWKLEKKTILIPHDLVSIRKLLSQLVDKARSRGCNITYQEICEKGSEAPHGKPGKVLQEIGYDCEAEMTAVYQHYQGHDPARKHLWSTFVVDKVSALYEDNDAYEEEQDEGDESESEASSGDEIDSYERKQKYAKQALDVIASHVDQHCKGQRLEISARQVARDIAAAHDIPYWDMKAKRFVRRGEMQYFSALVWELRKFNSKVTTGKRRDLQDLLWHGSSGMPSLQKSGDSRVSQRRQSKPSAGQSRSNPRVVLKPGQDPANNTKEDTQRTILDSSTSPARASSSPASVEGPIGLSVEPESGLRPPADDSKQSAGHPGEHLWNEHFTPPTQRSGGASPLRAPLLLNHGESESSRASSPSPKPSDANSSMYPAEAASRRTGAPAETLPSRQEFAESGNIGDSLSMLGGRGHPEPPPQTDPVSGPSTKVRPAVAHYDRSGFLPQDTINVADQSLSSTALGSSMRTADSIFSLEERDLGDRLHRIHITIKSAIRNLLDGCGLDDTTSAMLHEHPSPNLAETYRCMLESADAPDVVWRGIENKLSASQLVVTLIGCALHKAILTPTTTPALTFGHYYEQRQKAFEFDSEIELLDAELHTSQTNFDTLLRGLYLRRVSSPQFRTLKAVQLATELTTHTLTNMLREHLHAVGCGLDDSKDEITQFVGVLGEVIKDAIILKCELSCAREEYGFRLARSGEVFEPGSMLNPYGGGLGTVVVSIFPGLFMQRNGVVEAVRKTLVRTL